MKNLLLLLIAAIIFFGCAESHQKKSESENLEFQREIEAITLLGDTLFSNIPGNSESLENFEKAKTKYLSNPNDIESIIWYGRRTAYLGKYQDAIDIYSKGIQILPDNARLYRHRGHRYISTRQYDKAIADFERAVQLIDGQANVIEQDGIPNAQNKPISSLHGNIYYHLALAYYLVHDLQNAERVYQKRITTHNNDDNIVSAGHWHYMTLRRIGKDLEARELLSGINKEMDIIENMHYHNMCLFYKGVLEEGDLQIEDVKGRVNEVFLYGLGNWNLYEKKDTIQAQIYFDKLLARGNMASFAFIAAEADYKNLFGK